MKNAKVQKPRFSKSAGPSPAALARKAVLRRIQKQELRKLQAVIPTTSRTNQQQRRRSEPDPCDVIYSAIRYIDQLHSTILARVRSGTLPSDVLERMNLNHLMEEQLAQNLVSRTSSTHASSHGRRKH